MLRTHSEVKAKRKEFYSFWAEALEKGWVDQSIDEHSSETGKELDFLRFAFDEIATRPVKRILDIACGYGRHSIPLAKDGYSVVARDSNLKMIELAKKRAAAASVEIEFEVGDMRNLKSSEEFDAAIVIYSLDYLIEEEDLSGTLKAIFGAIKEGGVLVAIVNNPYHALKKFTEEGSHTLGKNDVKILNAWKTEFNELTGLISLKEIVTVREGKKKQVFELGESFRYYNYGELKRFITEAGFTDVRCFGSFDYKKEATSKARRLAFVARKLEIDLS